VSPLAPRTRWWDWPSVAVGLLILIWIFDRFRP